MAGKGYNYADDYDDDWYDEDDNDMPDFEEEEDPELAAAVKAAAQQKKPANVKVLPSTLSDHVTSGHHVCIEHLAVLH